MSEITETTAKRQAFEVRHSALAGIPNESFPLALVLNVGDMPMIGYKPLLDSAFSTALEYADSPLAEIVISANATIQPNNAYLTNFLEGAIGKRILELKAGRLGVKWSGGEEKRSKRANENIAKVAQETAPGSQTGLRISFGRLEYKNLCVVSVEPEVVEKTDPVSGEAHKDTVFTNAGIDSAILAFSSSMQSPVRS